MVCPRRGRLIGPRVSLAGALRGLTVVLLAPLIAHPRDGCRDRASPCFCSFASYPPADWFSTELKLTNFVLIFSPECRKYLALHGGLATSKLPT